MPIDNSNSGDDKKAGDDATTEGRTEDTNRTIPWPSPQAHVLRAGQRFGAYDLIRLLGRGGFGEVWEAESVETGRRVALKVLTTLRAAAPKRFQREGQIAASLNHPRCVYVFGTEEVDGCPAITMELMPGGTLQDRLKAQGKLPAKSAVDFMLDIIEGLEAAHNAGIIHRDVKPSNCFIDEDGRCKIGDFGISKTLEPENALTAAGVFLGTPGYASPEQTIVEESMKSIRKAAFVILGVLAPIVVFGQSRVEFEVASIRPAAPATLEVSAGLKIDGSQVRATYLSLKDYIGLAYEMRIDQILGPDFLGSERFDIAAKLPDGGKPDQVPEMLQALLADRFQMQMHRDEKEFPVYALLIDRGGLKIAELPPDPEAAGNPGTANVAAGGNAAGVAIDFGRGSSFTLGATRLEVKKLGMPAFADMLTRFLDRPVIDMTDLKGNYDFALDLSPEDRNAMMIRSAIAAGVVLPPPALRLLDLASGDSLSNALQKAGLKLESRRAPLDVLVIDRIQKTPTEN